MRVIGRIWQITSKQYLNKKGRSMKINTEGTYTLKYTAEDACGNITTEERNVIAIEPIHVYGVEWDGSSSPLMTRTDESANFGDPQPAVANGSGSSPFDGLKPWSGMETVEDEDVGTLVKIPKFWYKWTRDGASMKLQISTGAQTDFLVSPAHADRGDGKGERDYVYVGRYHCNNNDYKSMGGLNLNIVPMTNITRDTARQNIHALGLDIWQYDFAMYWTIAMLYLVEYANWNTQETIGFGCGDYTNIREGLTNEMQYHTGTNAPNRSDKGSVQYRHIEGLWSNAYDWCDGIRFGGAKVYGMNNPADFADNSNGEELIDRRKATGFISEFSNPTASGFEYACFPTEVLGSNSTYICDNYEYNYSGQVLYVGGAPTGAADRSCGLFCMNSERNQTNAVSNIGCRLQKLP